MLPAPINTALLIAASTTLLDRGHPDALREVQRQMRLINQAYPHPQVLQMTDDCVRCVSALHDPPGEDDEQILRERARAAIERLRNCLEGLPDPSPLKPRARARS